MLSGMSWVCLRGHLFGVTFTLKMANRAMVFGILQRGRRSIKNHPKWWFFCLHLAPASDAIWYLIGIQIQSKLLLQRTQITAITYTTCNCLLPNIIFNNKRLIVGWRCTKGLFSTEHSSAHMPEWPIHQNTSGFSSKIHRWHNHAIESRHHVFNQLN